MVSEEKGRLEIFLGSFSAPGQRLGARGEFRGMIRERMEAVDENHEIELIFVHGKFFALSVGNFADCIGVVADWSRRDEARIIVSCF
jgi:hypothetical protein